MKRINGKWVVDNGNVEGFEYFTLGAALKMYASVNYTDSNEDWPQDFSGAEEQDR